MYHWKTGVMVAVNGPLDTCVYRGCRYSTKNLQFPARIVIYHLNNVWTVFLIHLMSSSLKKNDLPFKKI